MNHGTSCRQPCSNDRVLAKFVCDSSCSERNFTFEEVLSEHRDLDEVIGRLLESATADQLQIQRLKKRKLILKDEIARLHGKILPDIIA